MQIRRATPADAEAAASVLRRSITDLCTADHRGDEAILSAWLANKTPETVRRWIEQSGNDVMVAVEADRVMGVAAVTEGGEITLNYVAPEARFRGVSRALLAALEARAAARGLMRCTLRSTETARRFYHAASYVEEGGPSGTFGTSSGVPMTKTLRS